MGFSAGMLIYLSFAEVVPDSVSYFEKEALGENSIWTAVGILIIACALVALIGRLLPCRDIHHEHAQQHTVCEASTIYKTGIAAMAAIALHNATEGIAVFLMVLNNPTLGLPLIFSIAMHNIPCGVAIAIPIYAATDDRKRAVLMSLKCGLFTPLGAALAVLAVNLILSNFVLGIIMAVVGGVMVATAAFELYPASKKYERGGHTSLSAALGGVALMALLLAVSG